MFAEDPLSRYVGSGSSTSTCFLKVSSVGEASNGEYLETNSFGIKWKCAGT